MNFSIPTARALELNHINLRDEYHGEQKRKAVDLKVSGQWANTVLDQFHPALRSAMFAADGQEAGDVQKSLDLRVTELSHIRFAKMGAPVKWEDTIEGAEIHVHYGAGQPIKLMLCKVKDFRITPMEGGTVEIAFTISSSTELTEKIIGKLGVITGEIELALIPPAADAGGGQ